MVTLRSERSESGFTLVEVVVAMVVLAVGLMGLQALTISAIRSVAIGHERTEHAVFASSLLEEGMRQVRAANDCFADGPTAGTDVLRGHSWEREMIRDGNRCDITVRILRDGDPRFELEASVHVQ